MSRFYEFDVAMSSVVQNGLLPLPADSAWDASRRAMEAMLDEMKTPDA